MKKAIGVLLLITAFASCKKDDAELSTRTTPEPVADVWRFTMMTIDPKGGGQNLSKVNGLLEVNDLYMIRTSSFPSGYIGRDSIPCVFNQAKDSVTVTLSGTTYSGKYEVLGDTLYTVVPPYKFYK